MTASQPVTSTYTSSTFNWLGMSIFFRLPSLPNCTRNWFPFLRRIFPFLNWEFWARRGACVMHLSMGADIRHRSRAPRCVIATTRVHGGLLHLELAILPLCLLSLPARSPVRLRWRCPCRAEPSVHDPRSSTVSTTMSHDVNSRPPSPP